MLIAHGPNDDEANRRRLGDMESHARFLREHGRTGASMLTHRNDAPPDVKEAARRALRQRVVEPARERAAVVVPLLLSAQGVEEELEADLGGLDYRFADPLMPHPNIERRVEEQADALPDQRTRWTNARVRCRIASVGTCRVRRPRHALRFRVKRMRDNLGADPVRPAQLLTTIRLNYRLLCELLRRS